VNPTPAAHLTPLGRRIMRHGLSVALLDRLGACPAQTDLLALHFGSGTRRLTRPLLLEVATLGVNLGWLAYKMLGAPLDAEYWRHRATLYAEYKRQHAPLDAEYERQCTRLLADALGLPQVRGEA